MNKENINKENINKESGKEVIEVIYNKLQKPDKDLLDYAFENNSSAYIMYDDKHYIGINLPNNGCFKHSIEDGVWCVGEIHADNSVRS